MFSYCFFLQTNKDDNDAKYLYLYSLQEWIIMYMYWENMPRLKINVCGVASHCMIFKGIFELKVFIEVHHDFTSDTCMHMYMTNIDLFFLDILSQFLDMYSGLWGPQHASSMAAWYQGSATHDRGRRGQLPRSHGQAAHREGAARLPRHLDACLSVHWREHETEVPDLRREELHGEWRADRSHSPGIRPWFHLRRLLCEYSHCFSIKAWHSWWS